MMKYVAGLVVALASIGLMGCSGGAGSDASTDGGGGGTNNVLKISGALNTNDAQLFTGDNAGFAVDLANLEIYAIAFASSGPVIDQADVNASTGAFEVELPGAKGASVTAIVRDKTNTAQEVATIVFRDTSKKDLNGNPKDSSSVVLTDSVQLGNLSIGNDGRVVVDVQTIATVADNIAPPAASSSAFDMSGVWIASAYTGTKPADYYITTYDPSTCNEGGGYGCAGVATGFPLGLVRVSGRTFTPTQEALNANKCDVEQDNVVCAEADGTLSADVDRYALGVWDAVGFHACGYKTGFSEDEARAGGFLHPTGTFSAWSFSFPDRNGVTQNYSGTPSFGEMTGYNPYFWVRAAAQADRDYSDCRGINYGENNIPGYACKGPKMNGDTPSGGNGWMVTLGNGGCVNKQTQQPVFIRNWQGMQGTGEPCTNEAVQGMQGFTRSRCEQIGDPDGDGPLAEMTVVCAWTQGTFDDNSDAPNFSAPVAEGTHIGPPVTTIADGANCGGTDNISEAAYKNLSLAALQCHAEDYWRNRDSFNSSNCAPRPKFNYAARTAAEFYKVDYRPKPDSQFLMDLITYDTSGNLATMDTEEREGFTISTGSSSVSCEAVRRITLNIRKTGDNTALVDIHFTGRMASTAAACQAVARKAIENRAHNDSLPEDSMDRRQAVDNVDLEYILGKEGFVFNLTRAQ